MGLVVAMLFMKKSLLRIQSALMVLILALSGCGDEDKLAVVVTAPVTDITSTTANSGGTIDRKDGTPPNHWGLCWKASPGPTIADSRSSEFVNVKPTFLSSMEGLSPGTQYYVRAYSTNQAGTAYGNERSFTTLP